MLVESGSGVGVGHDFEVGSGVDVDVEFTVEGTSGVNPPPSFKSNGKGICINLSSSYPDHHHHINKTISTRTFILPYRMKNEREGRT